MYCHYTLCTDVVVAVDAVVDRWKHDHHNSFIFLFREKQHAAPSLMSAVWRVGNTLRIDAIGTDTLSA